MSKSKKEIEVSTKHPMEEVLDIEPGTTIVPKTVVSTDLVPHTTYDKKDDELDEQFQTIYDEALTAFGDQQEETEIIDPKYKARNAEVAAQFLNTALNAANSKMTLKSLTDKLEVSKARLGKVSTVNNNLIITDRNSILRLLEEEENNPNGDMFEDGEFEE